VSPLSIRTDSLLDSQYLPGSDIFRPSIGYGEDRERTISLRQNFSRQEERTEDDRNCKVSHRLPVEYPTSTVDRWPFVRHVGSR
jgi:hypothetical protein